MRFIVSILVLAVASGLGRCAFAQNESVDRAPLWTRSLAGGVEWAERVDCKDAAALLVCSRDARLSLLDPVTGRDRLPQPIVAGPGVRLAGDGLNEGEENGVVYCFDRYSIYALETGPRAQLRWRAGDRPQQPPDAAQGDPEFLRNIVAAQGVSGGVVVVRDDGQMALLEQADGRVRWALGLPALSSCRILAGRGRTSAVLWRGRGQTTMQFIDLENGRLLGAPRVLESWPLWSAWIAEGLILAGANQIAVWRADAGAIPAAAPFEWGPAVFRGAKYRQNIVSPLKTDIVFQTNADAGAILGATIDLYSRVNGAPLLIFIDAIGGWRACNTATGAVLWQVGGDKTTTEPWAGLRVRDRQVLGWRRAAFVVRAAETGAALAQYDGPADQPLVSAEIRDGFVWFVIAKEETAGRVLWLHRRALSKGSPPSAGADSFGPRRLGSADGVRQMLWARGCVVVVQQNGLRAYAIP